MPENGGAENSWPASDGRSPLRKQCANKQLPPNGAALVHLRTPDGLVATHTRTSPPCTAKCCASSRGCGSAAVHGLTSGRHTAAPRRRTREAGSARSAYCSFCYLSWLLPTAPCLSVAVMHASSGNRLCTPRIQNAGLLGGECACLGACQNDCGGGGGGARSDAHRPLACWALPRSSLPHRGAASAQNCVRLCLALPRGVRPVVVALFLSSRSAHNSAQAPLSSTAAEPHLVSGWQLQMQRRAHHQAATAAARECALEREALVEGGGRRAWAGARLAGAQPA